jgi:ABC-type iron transport system FetAB ATPase subunit
MSEAEKQEAIEYLRSPDLLDRIAADFEACGMVGNRNQNLLSYLGALSRLTDRPFGTLIVSRSGAGKSFLQDMIACMTPEESLLCMTRLTGQSLFYQGKDGLKHKLLTIEEDEGMQDAMYSIRTLLSSQKLTVHGLKTDAKSGEFKAYENTVHGPASVMISTTNLSSFTFENVNRFFILFLDESREQTQAILEHQRRTSGLAKISLKVNRQRIEKLHRNIQRLIKPVLVINKIGTGIEYPADILNTRREQTKTEALIETVALLHQYQRTIKTETVCGVDMQYIEVTKQDIEAVHAIAGDILKQSLDEMPKLCRDLLDVIHELVNEKFRAVLSAKERDCPERWQITFTRKELQERSRWSRWHLEEHLKELEDAGYITQRMGKKGQRYAYSLIEETIPQMPDMRRTI